MKKFNISPGVYNPVDQNWKPIEVSAKTWKGAIDKAIKEGLIPKDAYSIQILEVPPDSNEDEEKELALHFREWREDQLLKKYIYPFEGWML